MLCKRDTEKGMERQGNRVRERAKDILVSNQGFSTFIV